MGAALLLALATKSVIAQQGVETVAELRAELLQSVEMDANTELEFRRRLIAAGAAGAELETALASIRDGTKSCLVDTWIGLAQAQEIDVRRLLLLLLNRPVDADDLVLINTLDVDETKRRTLACVKPILELHDIDEPAAASSGS
ncbi:MAG: hypothetical protein AAFZ58_12360 [Pseudomonadota bacterium]